MPYFDYPSGRLHYTFSLKEPEKIPTDRVPLVLIPGAGESVMHWPPQLRRHKEWPIFALDLPGHGDSEGDPCATVAEYAQVAADFIQGMGLEKVVLVGHSMGGGIALVLLAEEPEWLAGLVLAATSARLKVSSAILNGLTADFDQITQQIVSWSYGPDSEALQEKALSEMRKIDPALLLNDFNACNKFDMEEELPETDLPILILCGTHDFMTPPKFSDSLHQSLPGSQLIKFEGAGHMLQLEKAVEFTEHVVSFWEDQ